MTLYVKRVTAQGDVGTYVEVDGVDFQRWSVSKLIKHWIDEAAPGLPRSLVQLCLVPCGTQKPDSTQEKAAAPLDGRDALASAGVSDCCSLLAFVSDGSPSKSSSSCPEKKAPLSADSDPPLSVSELQRQVDLLSQEQRRIRDALPLLGALFQRNVRYSDSKHASRDASMLKGKLALLEQHSSSQLRCMLLNLTLPYASVVASHLLKREWDYMSRELANVDDVEDVRNGLLLYKPLQWAFDTSRLVFVWDGSRDAFVAHVLDADILQVRLAEKAKVLLGLRYRQQDEAIVGEVCFQDVHLKALTLPLGFTPWRRCLCFHAHMARDQAARRGWLDKQQFEFDDFWSEDLNGVDKVRLWLSAQAECRSLAEETSDTPSESS